MRRIANAFLKVGYFLVTVLSIGIAEGRAQSIYVSYSFTEEIHRYGLDGSDLGSFISTGIVEPTGIAFDRQGNLYVDSSVPETIEKYSPAGDHLGTVARVFNGPGVIAFDSSGNLLVLTDFDHMIRKLSPDGTDLGAVLYTGTDVPEDFAIDHKGNIFVANYNNSFSYGYITKYDPSGNMLANYIIPFGGQPVGLTFDEHNNLYAADYKFGQIDVLNDQGLFTTFETGLNKPLGMTFDTDGNLYVVNNGDGTIQKYDASGNHIGSTLSVGPRPYLDAIAISPVPEPTGIGLGTAGTLCLLGRWVSVRRCSQIKALIQYRSI